MSDEPIFFPTQIEERNSIVSQVLIGLLSKSKKQKLLILLRKIDYLCTHELMLS